MNDCQTKREFDDILREQGEFGRYQKILYFGTCLLIIPVGLQIFILVFATGTPNFHCEAFDTHNQSVITANRSALVKPNTCHNNCSRYSFDGPFTSIVSEWNLICDRQHYSALSQSLFMAGMLIGSILFGSISDWFGRKPTLFITTLLTVALGIGSSFANSLSVFVALRFFVGGTVTGMMLTSYVYFLEVVGPTKRTLAGKVQDLFWAGIGMFVALLGYLVREWRYSLLAASLPGVLFLPFWKIFPESTRWLVAKNRLGEAQQILQRYDDKRSTNPEKLRKMLEEIKASQDGLRDSGKTKPTLMDLVRGPRMRKRTLICCFNWFVISFGFYGLMLNVTNLYGNMYINFFLLFLIEIPSTPISWYFLQRYGRRIPYVIFICLGGLVMLLVLAVPKTPENGPIITTIAMIGKFCVAMSFSSIYIYTSELYPTVIRFGVSLDSIHKVVLDEQLVSWVASHRPFPLVDEIYWQAEIESFASQAIINLLDFYATRTTTSTMTAQKKNLGLGTSSLSARIGSVVAPYIVMMAKLPSLNDETVPLVILGIMCLLAGAAAFFLPETLKCNMPQTLEEVETAQEDRYKIFWCWEKEYGEVRMKDKTSMEKEKGHEIDGLLETPHV